MNENFAVEAKAAMRAMGISQCQLAAMTESTQATISRVMVGTTKPNHELALKIIRALQMVVETSTTAPTICATPKTCPFMGSRAVRFAISAKSSAIRFCEKLIIALMVGFALKL